MNDEWIKCSERKPPINTDVLAYAKESFSEKYEIIKAIYYDRYKMKGRKPQYRFYESCHCSGCECDEMMIDHVSHWMKLPSIPKEVKENVDS